MSPKSIHDIIVSKETSQNATSLLNLLASEGLENTNKDAIKNLIDDLLTTQKDIFENKSPIDSLIVDGLDVNQIFEQYNIILQVLSPKLLNDIKELSSVLEANDEGSEEEYESEEESELRLEQTENENEDESDGEAHIDEHINDPSEEVSENDEEEFYSANDSVNSEAEEEEVKAENDNESVSGDEEKDKFFDAQSFLKQLDDAEERGIDLLDNENGSDSEDIDYFGDIPSEEDEEADYYNDFFDKPEEKPKSKKEKSSKKKLLSDDLSDNEIDKMMNNVRKDLFSDEESEYSDEDEEQVSGATEGNQTKILSSHERQQLEIQRQIQQLEEKAVEDKHWGMKGESNAKNRPKDALVEEEVELEFESNAKSVPVITSEIVESIEEIIKKRIKEMQFDDLEKRIINTNMKPRRTREEVSQVKSKVSLADQYKEADDEAAVDRDLDEFEESEELKEKHKEIDTLFDDVMYTLNALSSAHFTPKPVKSGLEVKLETSAITMEDQQPLIQSAESSLAPQEIYKNSGSNKLREDDVVLKNGLTVNKNELTKEERQRMRRSVKRKRSKLMKQKDESNTHKKSKVEESIDVLKNNSKHITVVGKDGKSTDSKGKAKKQNTDENTKFIGSYKL
ncbi:rRNA-processing protein [Hanseniaspora uvarum]|nr:rRNA-processing protein [Hanseniaspora uvarum]